MQKNQISIDHVGLYVDDLESARHFFVRFFGATCHPMYHNPKTGLRSYFLSLGGNVRLELLNRPETQSVVTPPYATGYEHLAVSVGSRVRVDTLTQQLSTAGYTVASPPRVTGDGYYESVVLGPSNCRIEITE